MNQTAPHPDARLAAWFAGPKAENGDRFSGTIQRIIQDYHSWRRNYFPDDGVVIDSALRRLNEPFQDAFDDRLLELLGRLKNDFPFHSPRYAAHMVAEQTLPSIAGWFAAMLYNPNNISSESAPVTVRLEVEAAQMLARMLGYGADSWAHLTSGGTIANIEALWIARTIKYLPAVIQDMRRSVRLPRLPWPDEPRALLRISPSHVLQALAQTFRDASEALGTDAQIERKLIRAYLDSPANVVERGLAPACAALGSMPVVLVPETHHYCFEKAMDALGFGRRSLVRVRVDSHFRMIVGDLALKLDQAEDEGAHVVAVVAAVGTTEEGAVDPVDEIVRLRERREAAGLGSFWLHADAAYGGYLRTMVVPTRIGLGEPSVSVKVGGDVYRLSLHLPERSTCNALEELGHCDSITVDPHKLGYIPYPAGAVCFRSNLVKPLVRQEASYLDEPALGVEGERRSEGIGLYSLEGSRPGAAAAAVWLSHSLIPLDNTGHGVLMQETIRNACELHALLEAYPALAPGQNARAVCLCPPGSNIVCYAFCPAAAWLPGASAFPLNRLNALNRRIYERFTLRAGERVYGQSFFVSRTTLSADRYPSGTVAALLERLGVSMDEYQSQGVFLLRSVLMNPWYTESKRRGRFFLSELVAELYTAASEEIAREARPSPAMTRHAIVATGD